MRGCLPVLHRSPLGGRHIVLSDGMGSGTAAAVDANMTVSLITKLIDAGVSYTAALKIVNSALLVKSGGGVAFHHRHHSNRPLRPDRRTFL